MSLPPVEQAEQAVSAQKTHTLTKAELAERLVDTIGLNQREAKAMVEVFFETIVKALERGEEVKLAGFGSFLLHDKKERPGRNPKTGEKALVSARRVVKFRASPKLKSALEKEITETL